MSIIKHFNLPYLNPIPIFFLEDKMKKLSLFFIAMLFMLPFIGCKNEQPAKLLYQGHASFRLVAKNGTVVYIDPFAGEGYDLPADIILVTHQHSDHNKIDLIKQNKGCVVISNEEALKDKKHNTFKIKGIKIESVEAKNFQHHPSASVGYIITVDGISLYHAGDTSKTDQMSTLQDKNLNYAILPCDGVFNMNPEAAAECARIIGAQHNIPIHTGPFSGSKPAKLLDRTIAERFDAPNRLILEPGEEIEI